MALGSILGSGISAASSAKQAQKQMDFQKEMASTKYQRGTEDLKKAGLNPILAAGGATADSAGGAMGQTPDFGSTLTNAKQAKIAEQKAEQEIAIGKETEELTRQSARKMRYEADVSQYQRGLEALIAEGKLKGAEKAISMGEKVLGWFGGQQGSSAKSGSKPLELRIGEGGTYNAEQVKSLNSNIIRPWGEYPSLADPDFKRKHKYYRALQKGKK